MTRVHESGLELFTSRRQSFTRPLIVRGDRPQVATGLACDVLLSLCE